MEETREDAGPAEQGPSNANKSWWPSDFIEKFGSVSLDCQDETLNDKESPRHSDKYVLSPQKASQILWRTGMLSEPIPNGFYSVLPVRIGLYILSSFLSYCCFLTVFANSSCGTLLLNNLYPFVDNTCIV